MYVLRKFVGFKCFGYRKCMGLSVWFSVPFVVLPIDVRGFVLMFLFIMVNMCMEFYVYYQSKFTRFGCWLTLGIL